MSSRPQHEFHRLPQSEPPILIARGLAGDPLPTFDLDSDDPLPLVSEVAESGPPESSASSPRPARIHSQENPPRSSGEPAMAGRQPGALWLEGDALMCACPDCGVPMSVRLWLLLADCWSCGASIELSEEQQRQVERLLRRRRNEPSEPPRRQRLATASGEAVRAGAPSAPSIAATAARTPETPRPAARPMDRGPTPPPRATPARRRAPPSRRSGAPSLRGSRRRRLQSWFNDTPAWLVSLIIHLVMLMLLGLLTLEPPRESPYITLSTSLSREFALEGDNTQAVDPEAPFAFDLPLPQDADLKDAKVREALIRADQDARELRLAENTADPFLPDLESVKERIHSSEFSARTLAARDPRIRKVLVAQEGGTTLTEAAVARGLRWLARQQKADGRWVIDGGVRSDAAATSLALLPFLGAGQTHLTGKYQKEVASGLRWLLEHQQDDGDLAAGSSGNSRMYAHGQGAIVLCEALAITGDEQLRPAAQKAIDFIVEAQHPAGGWRYQPGQAGDTSVLGWQLMALQSARAAGLAVPPATLENAGHYLDSVSHHNGARYGYMPGHGPTEVMTAEALLCRMYLGWTLADHGLREGVRWLSESHLPRRDRGNFYYWYYATQVFHHVGGRDWERWNLRLRDILVNTQEQRGKDAGSWRPEHHHDRPGGRIYATALAVCTLEVYYRHAPIFRQIDLD